MGRSILLTVVAVLLPAVPIAQAAVAPVSLSVGLVQMIERGDLSTQSDLSVPSDQTLQAALRSDLRAVADLLLSLDGTLARLTDMNVLAGLWADGFNPVSTTLNSKNDKVQMGQPTFSCPITQPQ